MSRKRTKRRKEMIKVACCGTYDYRIHEGHIEFLKFASSFGDHLCVFVVPDWVVAKNKNRDPIYNQSVRCKNILSLSMVNETVSLSGDELLDVKAIIDHHPDIYIFGRDQFSKFDGILEAECIKTKIIVKRSNLPGIDSTTKTLKRDGLLA